MKNKIRFEDGSYQVEYAPGQWGQFACTAHTHWSFPDQGRNAALRAASPKPEEIVKALNEHAALLAVAEAAEVVSKMATVGDEPEAEDVRLREALATLATVRANNKPISPKA